MAKTRLLTIACTVAMLVAAPAFAQSETEVGSTGPGGTAVNPTAHETMPKSHAGMSDHSGRRRMMGHTGGMMPDKMSKEASADKLNDQSYQAAKSGQPFSMGAPMAPGGSGGMNDSAGGAMSNNGSSSNGSK